jgi:hypothetical protein
MLTWIVVALIILCVIVLLAKFDLLEPVVDVLSILWIFSWFD